MEKINQNKVNFPERIDTIHICLPCENMEKFAELVVGYVEQFKPKLTIINSTVPPGTTLKVYQKCECHVAHSPLVGFTKVLHTCYGK
jgi:hypothetical protein